MKGNKEFYRITGLLIYLLISTIDRFVIKIPDVIFIGITVVAAIFLVYSLITERKH